MGVLAVAALLALGAVGCSKAPPPQSDLVDALVTSGVPKTQASCAAKAVYSTLTDKQVRDVIDRGASGVPKNDPNRSDDPNDRLTQALSACRTAVEDTTPPATTTTVPVATTRGASINTTAGTGSTTGTSVPPADGTGADASTTTAP